MSGEFKNFSIQPGGVELAFAFASYSAFNIHRQKNIMGELVNNKFTTVLAVFLDF